MKTILMPSANLVTVGAVPVSPAEFQHLRVRRAADGETVRVIDGEGRVAHGMLELGQRNAVVHLDVVERVEAPTQLILAVGAGDRDRFGWLVEKAAEVAVTEVIPLDTSRSRAVANRVRAGHIERLASRAREAVKQSGSAWAPVVRALTPLGQFLDTAPTGIRWLADARGGWPGDVPADDPMLIAVGPEGGFTTAERAALAAAGFQTVRLGPLTLRFETAAIAAAAYASIQRTRGDHD